MSYRVSFECTVSFECMISFECTLSASVSESKHLFVPALGHLFCRLRIRRNRSMSKRIHIKIKTIGRSKNNAWRFYLLQPDKTFLWRARRKQSIKISWTQDIRKRQPNASWPTYNPATLNRIKKSSQSTAGKSSKNCIRKIGTWNASTTCSTSWKTKGRDRAHTWAWPQTPGPPLGFCLRAHPRGRIPERRKKQMNHSRFFSRFRINW